MGKQQRRRLTAREKVRILREHLIEHKPVSEVCEAHGLNPTCFYRWQKELFDNGAAAFARTSDAAERKLQARLEQLQGSWRPRTRSSPRSWPRMCSSKKELGEP